MSRKKDIVEIPSSNILYDTPGGGGGISLGVKVNVGLELQLRNLPQFNYLEEGKVSYTCCDFPNGQTGMRRLMLFASDVYVLRDSLAVHVHSGRR